MSESDTQDPDRLTWILNSDQAALEARYDEWAATYDDDHDEWGWRGPELVAAAVLGHLGDSPAGQPIYDAGCGTGRAGLALRSAGWEGPIVGLDLSGGMLDVAKQTGAYSSLLKCSLYDIPTADRAGCAVVASGVFTAGHVTGAAFAELARITAPHGPITITLRVDLEDQFTGDADALSTAGAWRQVERSVPAQLHPDASTKEQSITTWRRSSAD